MIACFRTFLLLCALPLVAPSAAAASSVATVQYTDGVSHSYYHAVVRVLGDRAVRITSSDSFNTIVVRHTGCAQHGMIVSCKPYWMNIIHSGRHRRLTFARGSEYFNRGRIAHTLPNSSTLLEPHGAMIFLVSRSGVKVTVRGKIDRYYR